MVVVPTTIDPKNHRSRYTAGNAPRINVAYTANATSANTRNTSEMCTCVPLSRNHFTTSSPLSPASGAVPNDTMSTTNNTMNAMVAQSSTCPRFIWETLRRLALACRPSNALAACIQTGLERLDEVDHLRGFFGRFFDGDLF